MVHLCPKRKLKNWANVYLYIPSGAEETIARNSASHEDKLFCALLLLNSGQLLNAWNPPDVDFLLLLFQLQSESKSVPKHQ